MLHARFPALTPTVEGSVIRPLLRTALPAALALLAAAPLAAQRTPRGPTAAAVERAAATITEADIRNRIAVIADDSMRGRATPSPELDQTAAYIAAEFQRFGLRPGGDSGTFIQRYRIRRTQLDSSSFVMAMGRGTSGRWAFGREVTLFQGAFPDSTITAPAVLVVGVPADTARPFGDVNVRGAIILQTISLAQLRQQQLLQAGSSRASPPAFAAGCSCSPSRLSSSAEWSAGRSMRASRSAAART